MSDIKVIRKGNGQLFRNTDKRVVFVKDGVNFSMNEAEMRQMNQLIDGVLEGTMEQVKVARNELVMGD